MNDAQIISVTPQNIYNLLATGKSVELDFADRTAAIRFKNSMAVIKCKAVREIKALAIPVDELLLSMDYNTETGIATFYLRPPQPKLTFTVVNIINSKDS